jgi:hypothetical protein
MRLRRAATRRLGIPVLAAALAVGCGGAPRPLSAALLPESALPPGLQYQQVTEFPDRSQAFANLTVRPTRCGSPELLQPYGDPSELETAVHVGSGRGVTLTVGLVRGPDQLDLDSARRTVSQCSTFTVETPGGRFLAELTEVPAPEVDADDVFAYRQRLRIQERPVREMLFLAAVDGGVVVTVTGSAGDGDMALYTELLRRSLQRKEEVLG